MNKLEEYIRACDTVAEFAGDIDVFISLVYNKIKKMSKNQEIKKEIKINYYSKLQKFPYYFVFSKPKKVDNVIYLDRHLTTYQ